MEECRRPLTWRWHSRRYSNEALGGEGYLRLELMQSATKVIQATDKVLPVSRGANPTIKRSLLAHADTAMGPKSISGSSGGSRECANAIVRERNPALDP